jgi:predicted nucleotidyltransferase
MNKIIINNQKYIQQLCSKYHVEKLEVFGSATRNEFDPTNSDIDFLVDFDSIGIENYADNYFGLKTSLQNLFKTPVDLIVSSTIKNPYFLKSIEADRQFLYAA